MYLIASTGYIISAFPEAQGFIDYEGFYSPSSCLHIAKLKRTTTKDDLKKFFLQYAHVKSIRIKEYHGEK